jgi:hypothetical protein
MNAPHRPRTPLQRLVVQFSEHREQLVRASGDTPAEDRLPFLIQSHDVCGLAMQVHSDVDHDLAMSGSRERQVSSPFGDVDERCERASPAVRTFRSSSYPLGTEALSSTTL